MRPYATRTASERRSGTEGGRARPGTAAAPCRTQKACVLRKKQLFDPIEFSRSLGQGSGRNWSRERLTPGDQGLSEEQAEPALLGAVGPRIQKHRRRGAEDDARGARRAV